MQSQAAALRKTSHLLMVKVHPLKLSKTPLKRRACNICGSKFSSRQRFERYCDTCRAQSELYHFADWMSA